MARMETTVVIRDLEGTLREHFSDLLNKLTKTGYNAIFTDCETAVINPNTCIFGAIMARNRIPVTKKYVDVSYTSTDNGSAMMINNKIKYTNNFTGDRAANHAIEVIKKHCRIDQ
jgi:hypothetical protein